MSPATATAPSRLRLAAWLSVVSLVGVIPHVIEDATLGFPDRFGLSPVAAAWLFGLFSTAQIVAALSAVEGRRWAPPAIVVIGLVWAVGALVEHPDAFQAGSFRSGLSSRVWIWLIVALQGGAAWLAGREALGRRA